jgi:predicted ATPase/DNA-binding SARP family transcriptional activator/tetratricopeptide (TPR) repeat protein
MQIRLLGTVEVLVDGRSATPRATGERSLLALLALSAGRVVSADVLLTAMWGEDLPAHPANALQVRASKLRRRLSELGAGERSVVARPPGYLLDVPPDDVDVHRCTRLLAEARRVTPVDGRRAAGLYRQAMALWRGPALAEFPDAAWAQQERVRLDGLRATATEELFDLELAAGSTADLPAEIEAAVIDHPLRERLHGQLMLALYRCGRQADALAAFQRARALLRTELGLDPSAELRDIEQAILRQEPDLLAPPAASSLPPRLPNRLNSFVGRDPALHQLRGLVAEHRCVTVTGPGGVGKTSLAVEVARSVQEPGSNGQAGFPVWFARLAGVADPALVPRAVCDAVGIRDDPVAAAEQQLLSALRDRPGLLVLDNCEHLADACAVLAERLLGTCPLLRLLATSREPLAATGEVQYALAPLETAPAGTAAAGVAGYPAARLFTDRASAVLPLAAFDDATMLTVAEICRRLDGIPLAIELAAAGVKSLPVAELAARVRQDFPALSGAPRTAEARHRTLRATVDWSHELLSAPERVLFRRLGVFRGGFDLDAAEHVTAGGALRPAEVLGLLTRLVDRSLVIALHGPPARFHLLETLRQYAAERLVDAGESEQLAAAHAAHYTALAGQGESGVRGPDQPHWLDWLTRERDNVQSALSWCVAHADDDPDRGLHLVGALGWFWYFASRPDGGLQVERMLAAAAHGSPAARARAQLAAAVAGRPAACIVHPSAACAAAAERSLQLFTDLADTERAAMAATLLAVEGIADGDIADPLRRLDVAEEEFRGTGDRWGEALVLFVRMELHFAADRPTEATRHGRRALAMYRELQDHWGLSAIQLHLAVALHRVGELAAARDAYAGALEEGRKAGVANTIQYALAGMGNLALQSGDGDQARRCFTQAHQVARQLGAEGSALAALGDAAQCRQDGDLAGARHSYTRALDLLAAQPKPDWTATALSGLGHVAELTGDFDAAEFSHRRAWQTARGPAAHGPAAAALEGLACVAAARGDASTAAALLGAARWWRASHHRPASTVENVDIERATRRGRELLGVALFAACIEQAADREPPVLGELVATLA